MIQTVVSSLPGLPSVTHSGKYHFLLTNCTFTFLTGGATTWDRSEKIPVEAPEMSRAISIGGAESLASLANNGIRSPFSIYAVLRSFAALYNRRYVCEVHSAVDEGE
jgi:hypothetical protein